MGKCILVIAKLYKLLVTNLISEINESNDGYLSNFGHFSLNLFDFFFADKIKVSM